MAVFANQMAVFANQMAVFANQMAVFANQIAVRHDSRGRTVISIAFQFNFSCALTRSHQAGLQHLP
jgi:hypothetical protein